MNRGAWGAPVHRVAAVRHNLAWDKQKASNILPTTRKLPVPNRSILPLYLLHGVIRNQSKRVAAIINRCYVYVVWLLNCYYTTFEELKEVHETFHCVSHKMRNQTMLLMMAFIFLEIPPTAVPPIPLLLPLPEEKKPPAKRVEGIICYLPKCQNIGLNYWIYRPGKYCLVQHVGPLVVSRLDCLSKCKPHDFSIN